MNEEAYLHGAPRIQSMSACVRLVNGGPSRSGGLWSECSGALGGEASHASTTAPPPLMIACDAGEQLVVQVRPYGHQASVGGRAAAIVSELLPSGAYSGGAQGVIG